MASEKPKSGTAALRALLPELEKAGEWLSDGDIARLICAFQGSVFKRVIYDPISNRLYIHRHGDDAHTIQRDRCPDVDLTAADALVAEVLPGWARSSIRRPNGTADCTLAFHGEEGMILHSCENGFSEPLAILIALVRAKIAETENA